YLGWICIVTIANVTALLVYYGWNGFNISQEIWTIVMIFAGTLIASVAMFRLDNPFTGLAVVWAFIGIAIKRQDDHRSVFISAIIASVLVAVLTIRIFIKRIPT
ncbi:MAG TPA: hypothetical protein PLX08_11815, partial [Bacteroidales bacterium]|nr:hypothetical protein [Bacteroidales bacterium]